MSCLPKKAFVSFVASVVSSFGSPLKQSPFFLSQRRCAELTEQSIHTITFIKPTYSSADPVIGGLWCYSENGLKRIAHQFSFKTTLLTDLRPFGPNVRVPPFNNLPPPVFLLGYPKFHQTVSSIRATDSSFSNFRFVSEQRFRQGATPQVFWYWGSVGVASMSVNTAADVFTNNFSATVTRLLSAGRLSGSGLPPVTLQDYMTDELENRRLSLFTTYLYALGSLCTLLRNNDCNLPFTVDAPLDLISSFLSKRKAACAAREQRLINIMVLQNFTKFSTAFKRMSGGALLRSGTRTNTGYSLRSRINHPLRGRPRPILALPTVRRRRPPTVAIVVPPPPPPPPPAGQMGGEDTVEDSAPEDDSELSTHESTPADETENDEDDDDPLDRLLLQFHRAINAIASRATDDDIPFEFRQNFLDALEALMADPTTPPTVNQLLYLITMFFLCGHICSLLKQFMEEEEPQYPELYAINRLSVSLLGFIDGTSVSSLFWSEEIRPDDVQNAAIVLFGRISHDLSRIGVIGASSTPWDNMDLLAEDPIGSGNLANVQDAVLNRCGRYTISMKMHGSGRCVLSRDRRILDNLYEENERNLETEVYRGNLPGGARNWPL